MNITAAVSASAAILAAVLAGLNLYVTGRREEARWARDVLLGTLEGYLSASFEITSAATLLTRTVSSSIQAEEIEAQVVAAHDVQMRMLTRLRLLADEQIVVSAADLHRSDHEIVEFMRGLDHAVTPQELEAAQKSAHAHRQPFVVASRRMMKVHGKVAKVENV
jgi:hypothetical protein